MLSIYPACFFKEDEGGYSVIFPDLNHLATCGADLNEAVAMAVDCLAGYIFTCQQNGEDIPEPSSMDAVDPVAIALELDPDSPCGEAFVNMVSVDAAAYAREHFEKSVRKSITIPAWLNATALEMNLNFSQVLQEALLLKIAK